MHHILVMLAAAGTLVGTVSAQATDESVDQESFRIQRPFLWKIEPASDDSAASYLFGTIHVPDEAFTTLQPATRRVFDAAEAAYFEVDFLKNMNEQIEAISLPADQRLEDLVPEELLERLDTRLKKISPLMSRDALPPAQVVVWPLLLGNLEAQVRELGKLPLDLQLYMEAKGAGKTVGGLEDVTKQLKPLIDLPLEEQITFLRATLDGMDEDDAEGINRLELTMQEYASGDAERFGQFMMEELERIEMPRELTDRIVKVVLIDRNQTMAESIDKLITESPDKPLFFAVGVGHLTGKDSVQDFLNQRGYEVTRVQQDGESSR